MHNALLPLIFRKKLTTHLVQVSPFQVFQWCGIAILIFLHCIDISAQCVVTTVKFMNGLNVLVFYMSSLSLSPSLCLSTCVLDYSRVKLLMDFYVGRNWPKGEVNRKDPDRILDTPHPSPKKWNLIGYNFNIFINAFGFDRYYHNAK